MSVFLDLQGQIFNKWTVLGEPKRQGHSTTWLCRCDCGTVKRVNGYSMRTDISKQCQNCHKKLLAANRKKIKDNNLYFKLSPGEAALNRLFRSYRSNAKTRGREFSLDKNTFKQLVISPCHYCGTEPKQKQISVISTGVFLYNGVDRVDNKKGYTPKNTLSCCGTCNKLKGTLSYTDFVVQIKSIYNHFKLNEVL